MVVGLVIVSHSSKIAAGVVDLAAQMAEGVRIVPAGGTDEDGIGTSFDKVSSAMAEADDGAGVVVLCDLGSAILTAETALDFVDDEVRERVLIADAPLVEGAVAAAVAAQVGGTLQEVVDAAESANMSLEHNPSDDTGSAAQSSAQSSVQSSPQTAAPSSAETAAPSTAPNTAPAGQPDEVTTGSTTLVNASGLHARPAAEFVRLSSTFDAKITINNVDAKSLLRIMSLGLGKGRTINLTASGPDARPAIDALVALIDSGFGE
jgi:PTS hybrid protein